MANVKEFKFKTIVDNQEVENTITSLDGFSKRIGELKEKLNTMDLNDAQYKEVQKELKRTEGAYQAVNQSQQSWLDTVAGSGGVVGAFGQSIKGAGKLFSNLDMAFKTSVIGLIATIIAKLVQKFSEMEGVLDPLNKITAIFSGTIGKLANVILPPISALLEGIALGAEKVINFFSELAGGSSTLGADLAKLEERQDSLNDTQADYELGLAKANRALQEAREIAGDSTKSLDERKKALMDAEAIERDIAAKGKARALEQARITAEQIAQSLNLSQAEIANLRKADAQYLESFATRVAAQKGLNQEQRKALLQQLGQAEQIAADEAKIGKKTQSQIDALNKEAADKSRASAKEKRDARKAGIDAEIKLLTQFADETIVKDEKYYSTLKTKLKAYYEEKNKLDDKDKKLTKEELELRQKEQTKAINDAVNGVRTQAEKTKELDAEIIASAEAVSRAKQKQTTDIVEQLKIQQQDADKKYADDKKKLEDNLLFAEQTYGKESEQYKMAQIAKNKADADYLTKKQETDTKIVDAEKAKKDAIINLDNILNQQLDTNQKDNLNKQLKNIQKDGDDKIVAYKKQLDDAVKIGALTVEEAGKKLEQFSKSVGTSIKEQTQAAIGQDFLDTVQKNLETALSGASVGYSATVKAVEDAQIKLDEAFKKGTITEAQYTEASLQNQAKMKAAREGVLNAINTSAAAVGNLASAFGEESNAGKALIKVQQALALTSTALALADSIAGLGKDIKKGFPTNLVAVASTLALIGTAFAQAKALFSKAKTSGGGGEMSETVEGGKRLAQGGIVSGPGSSKSDSIAARLSNGESVINANSTAMFGPILSAINQVGGGKPFAFGGLASSADMAQQQTNSLLTSLASSGNEPVKAYVVAQDMTSMQMFDRAAKSRSTL